MVSNSVLVAAAKSASYNMILQVLIRMVSFVSNAVILRFISKDVLGIINVRLMLLYSTTHCLSKEAFRRSCLCKFDEYPPQKVINVMWLSVPVCMVCGCLLRFVWLNVLEVPDANVVSHYSSGVNTVVFCVLIEMLAEPLYIIGQSFHFIKLKVITEGLLVCVKSVLMVILLSHWPKLGIYVFCISQMLASVFYTSLYYVYFTWYLRRKKFPQNDDVIPIHTISEILPFRSCNKGSFAEWKIFKLTWSFLKQTILKQILTEGERYVMTLLSILTFAEQGVYDVVSNLGSLAARFIFLPVEESGYQLFCHLLKRDEPAFKQKNAALCLSVLENLLKLMVLLGFTILTFGFSYSQLLLFLYGGQNLSSSSALHLLRWHCVYILFLAINGVTECFVFAAMSHQDIDRYNRKMLLLSIAFLAMAYYLTTWLGSVGFILANCFNMAVRIGHSLFFINDYFGKSRSWVFTAIVPHPIVLLVYFITFAFTSISEANLCCSWSRYPAVIAHFVIGSSFLITVLAVIMLKEKPLIHFIHQQWIKRDIPLSKSL